MSTPEEYIRRAYSCPFREAPKDYMPVTHQDFASLWHYYGGSCMFVLTAPDKPPLIVHHMGTPTMCGGTHIYLRGLGEHPERRSPPPASKLSRNSASNFFDYHRRGVIIMQATLTGEEAAAWLPVINTSIALLGDYYERRGDVMAAPSTSWSQAPLLAPMRPHDQTIHVGTGSGRMRTYLWMLQHAEVSKHNAYTKASRVRCGICGEMTEGAMCRPCGNWMSGGHSAYSDDDGLSIDKHAEYHRNSRYIPGGAEYLLNPRPVSAHMQFSVPSPLLYLTSWYDTSGPPLPNTRANGSVLEILRRALLRRYIPVLTSNVGATGNARTPHVMASLYRNQELLAEHGMRLCTADTFGTNPKEHYHWIDSMAVVPISWGAITGAQADSN